MSTKQKIPPTVDEGSVDLETPDVNTVTPAKRSKRFKWISIGMAGLVVIMIATIFMKRGHEAAPAATGRVPTVNPGDPTLAPEAVADRIKERDAAAVEKIKKDKAALVGGVSYTPQLTREFEDPLAQFATPASTTLPSPPEDRKTPSDPAPENVSVVAPPIEQPPGDPIDPYSGRRADGSYPPVGGYTQGKQLAPRSSGTSDSRESEEAARRREDRIARMTTAIGNMNRTGLPEIAVVSRSGADASTRSTAATDELRVSNRTSTSTSAPAEVLSRLGTMLYGVTDLVANSDSSKFIQATVVAGPFTGAKVQGSFKQMKNNELELTFDRISWNDGTYRIDALAVDPNDPKVGLVSQVDHHYFTRFGGLIGAAMIRGAGEETARQGTSVTFNGNGTGVTGTTTTVPKRSVEDLFLIGAGEAAEDASDLIRDYARRGATSILDVGSPIGILFVQDWIDKKADTSQPIPTARETSDPMMGATLPSGYTAISSSIPDDVPTLAPAPQRATK